MENQIESNDMEARIIQVAKSLFVEKGFTETSMSEIASRLGINRPGLHYYFRTKDRLFKAVFGMIVQSIMPKVLDILQKKEEPISERIRKIVDTYYDVFRENPSLPMFILKEMNRDVNYLIDTIVELQAKMPLERLVESLQEEMAEGKLKPVPIRIVYFTFYSQLIYPFVTKKLSCHVLLKTGETFDDLLTEWKPYIVSQMENLLSTK